ncbi:dTMP kinase [Brachyspira murdochii]|uniref:Thymidylate kinase n=1 Tax=Brachyspira murdochii TaxID=84378 RepID=A0ABX5B9A0_9SPIR|nr:dTMP kinase [Brachyspira murdochii]PPS23238.1 thymidylate kinase [Brachyspira murdochii]
MNGKLIVIEGIDGSGKSTHGMLLTNELNNIGIKSIYTFEPTHAYFGSKLRESILSKDLKPEEELSLFIADRKEHVQNMIKPAINDGYAVILDRYMYSSIAYQGAKGIDREYIYNLHKDFIIEPDLVFIFHLPIETALNRIMEKRGFVDRFENKNYLKKVDEIFSSFNAANIHHINADKDEEALKNELMQIIRDSKILPLDSLQ